ncbi:hypothetical protein MLD38_038596 [Melastoma candidum]|uniref:Uncharacterized protein n=1 Tax=Melastoma candidum TaxID=119954 RepID=A0ACB9L0L3_9MYRT|nr:hypothetical protein MLD38_038596 [Melastoma candidum]
MVSFVQYSSRHMAQVSLPIGSINLVVFSFIWIFGYEAIVGLSIPNVLDELSIPIVAGLLSCPRWPRSGLCGAVKAAG